MWGHFYRFSHFFKLFLTNNARAWWDRQQKTLWLFNLPSTFCPQLSSSETDSLSVSSTCFQKDYSMEIYFKDFWYIFIGFFSSTILDINGTKNEVKWIQYWRVMDCSSYWFYFPFSFLFLEETNKSQGPKIKLIIVTPPFPTLK